MLLEYEQEQDFKNEEIQVYTEGMYHKKVHNSIEYDKSEVEIPEAKEKKKKEEKEKVALDPYEAYKQRKAQYGQYENEKSRGADNGGSIAGNHVADRLRQFIRWKRK